MAIREEMERQGRWLFKWRSYLPLLLLPGFIAALYQNPGEAGTVNDRVWWLCCLAISFAGLALRCMTVGYVPRKTSGRTTAVPVASTLNTTGIYSIVRHPLYLANYIIWLGPALAVRSWWLLLIVTLGFALYYERIMFAEEEYLRQQFGEEYLEWAARTPAFIPRFQGWKPSLLPYSFRTALKREYSGFFGIIVTFFFLDILRYAITERQFRIDAFWGALFLVGLFVHLTLLTLKKRTRLLYVEGR